MNKIRILVTLFLAAPLLAACSSKASKDVRSETSVFSVIAPATLVEQNQSIDTSSGKIDAHTYSVDINNITYVVAYTDFRDDVISHSTPEKMLNAARDSMITSIDGTLTLESAITLGEYPGRELMIAVQMADGNKGTLKAHVYLVKSRLFQVMVMSYQTDESNASIAKFFDSFKLK
jgi:hypothetical protein